MVTPYEEKIDKIARRLVAEPVAITASVRDQAIRAEFNGILPPKAIEDVEERLREIEAEEEER